MLKKFLLISKDWWHGLFGSVKAAENPESPPYESQSFEEKNSLTISGIFICGDVRKIHFIDIHNQIYILENKDNTWWLTGNETGISFQSDDIHNAIIDVRKYFEES